MPLILGTNSIKDTTFNVANSLRLDSGDSAYMHKTNGTATDVQKFTVSLWIKKNLVAQAGNEELVVIGDAGTDFFNIRSRADGKLQFQVILGDVGVTDYKTNAIHRDVSAWYHYVVAVDTTESSGDRIRIYVNGTEETSFASSTEMDVNTNLTFLTDEKVAVGRTSHADSGYFNGYMSEVVFINGLQLTPTSFGEFDSDSGIWKPKNVSGLTFGNNGFYLDFEDSGNLGNDANGGTDLTEVNLAATDQSIDTCTNNFATMNSIDNLAAGSAFSQGNLKIVTTSGI